MKKSDCSVDHCTQEAFAYCIIVPVFSGPICEDCYARNRPLWESVHQAEIEEWRRREEQ